VVGVEDQTVCAVFGKDGDTGRESWTNETEGEGNVLVLEFIVESALEHLEWIHPGY